MFSQVGRSPFIAMGILLLLLLLLLLGFWFKLVFTLVMLVLHWLRWYYVGCVGSVGISSLALVFRWLLSPR